MNFKTTDRISIDARSNHDRDKHSASMFKEDLGNALNRYGRSFDKVNCTLSNPDQEFIKFLKDSLPSSRSSYNPGLREIIFDSAKYILDHIVNIGYCALELVEYEDLNEHKHTRIERIIGDEIFLTDDHLVQVIKESNSKKEIPITKSFYIPLPKKYEGKDGFMQFIDQLNLSDELTPAMNFLHSNLRNIKGYDYKEHMRIHEIESWKLTNKFNWTHRKSSSDYFSGYYHIRKQLEFKLIQIELRDYTLEQLSEIVKTLSLKYGSENSISITGLTQSSEVKEVLSRWEKGDVVPNEITSVLF